MHKNAFTGRKTIVFLSLFLSVIPSQGFSGDPIGYVWPKQDLLIPDTIKGEFKELQIGKQYDLVKRVDTGYVILWQNIDGRPRLALVPFRDRLTNPTAHPYAPPITLINLADVSAQPGFVPLNAGDRYAVISRTNGHYSVVYTFGNLTQEVDVAENQLNYISFADYTSVMHGLVSIAESQLSTGGSPDYVAATFLDYNGKYAAETTSERVELASKYHQLSEERSLERNRLEMEAAFKEYSLKQQKIRAEEEAKGKKLIAEMEEEDQKFKVEQEAKGLVEYRGHWISPEEKAERLAEDLRLADEKQKRIDERIAKEQAYEDDQKAKGLIKVDGEWITKNEWKKRALIVDNIRFVVSQDGERSINGTVHNSSGDECNYLSVEFNLYDVSGRQVGNAYAAISGLEAAGNWSFEAPIRYDLSVASFKLNKIIVR